VTVVIRGRKPGQRRLACGPVRATQLARMVARAVVEPREPLAGFVAGLRSAFDLDSVGIVSRSWDGWQVLAAAGGPLPADPDAAQFAAEIAPARVMVMNGQPLTAADTRLLRVFAGELLLACRHAQQNALGAALSRETAGRCPAPRTAMAHPAADDRIRHPGSAVRDRLCRL